MKKRISFLIFLTMMLITLLLMSISCRLSAQPVVTPADTNRTQVYHTKPKVEIPVYLAIIGSASFGFKAMDKHASLDEETALSLDPESINAFDRPVAYYDPSRFKSAQATSDLLLSVFVVSPVLLLADKQIRKDWDDFLTIFLSAHAADNIAYFSAVSTVRRPRPLAYNPSVPLEEKTGDNKTNSFFSGHVTWVATSSFLMVRIYTDYHQIDGWKRLAMYAGAGVPPALVGYYRMQAGKHFPTDVLTGFVVGAACGILAPEFHRNRQHRNGLTMRPFSCNDANGVTLTYTFK